MLIRFKKVIVGISGGVDSAVTALLLKNKGYDVEGAFMQNWDIADEQGHCSASKDYEDAKIVCDKLGIKLHYVNFVKHYWSHVFSNLLKEYQSGYTPNPDILCNKYIKFDRFFKYATEHLKADAIATGHYANTNFGPYLEKYNPNKRVKLLIAFNIHKDQTFFLSQINQESLRRTMFPLGPLVKSEVREIALKNNLINVAYKKDSMGICFIGSRNFKDFISEYVDNKPGNFIDIETNQIKGTHDGIHHWTIGQRSRLACNSFSQIVARKDVINNNIYVASGRDNFALFTDMFQTSEPHWIDSEPKKLQKQSVLQCDFKFQHVEVLNKCWVFKTSKGLVVSLEKPMRALTAGQYAVFYLGNECLGSARIVHPGVCKYFTYNYAYLEIKKNVEIQTNRNVDHHEVKKKENIDHKELKRKNIESSNNIFNVDEKILTVQNI